MLHFGNVYITLEISVQVTAFHTIVKYFSSVITTGISHCQKKISRTFLLSWFVYCFGFSSAWHKLELLGKRRHNWDNVSIRLTCRQVGGAGLMIDVGGPSHYWECCPWGRWPWVVAESTQNKPGGGRQLAPFLPLCHRVYGLCRSSCPVALRDGAFPPQVHFVHGVLSQQQKLFKFGLILKWRKKCLKIKGYQVFWPLVSLEVFIRPSVHYCLLLGHFNSLREWGREGKGRERETDRQMDRQRSVCTFCFAPWLFICTSYQLS